VIETWVQCNDIHLTIMLLYMTLKSLEGGSDNEMMS
jgi:hypothetical protein